MVVTANLREWRHIIELRGSPKAQWEIREIVIAILRIFKKQVPVAFIDFKVDKKHKTINRIKP
ncbi:FAD-dependent thymidylate synthase [Candidatus Omnitrophota bacterium]